MDSLFSPKSVQTFKRTDASEVGSSKKSVAGTEVGTVGNMGNETPISPYGAEQELELSEWSKKPFVMPPDEEVFRIRALEKSYKDRKSREKTLPVSQKTTFASRMAATITSDKLKKELAEIDSQVTKEIEQMKSSTILPMEHYHKEKENMAEFIAKKREIFLVQMSLDNKRAEIRKLEDRIFQREEALRKSEEMLEEDTLHFEAFLKQNDEKVQEAIRKAEQQTRLKQEKLAEIKKLNSEIATTKKELNKFQEQLEECKKYKDFLIDLTPKEWLEEEREKSLQLKSSEALENHLETPLKVSEESENKGTGNNDEKEISEDESQQLLEPMYFRSPNQLLEIFSELEEKNLALLQESEDVESALEDLKARFSETRMKSETKIASLRSQLETLQQAIKTEEESQSNLQDNTNINMTDKKHDIPFEEIAAKVLEVYERCGFEVDPSLGTLQMLTNIEAKLEENITALEAIPAEFILQTEKTNEKERRLKLREEKLEQQRQEQERRAQKSLERAHAPIPKRIGKPNMFRSWLIKNTEKTHHVEKSDEILANEIAEFLARDF